MDVAREPHLVKDVCELGFVTNSSPSDACSQHQSHMRVASVATQTDDEVLAATCAATAAPAPVVENGCLHLPPHLNYQLQ